MFLAWLRLGRSGYFLPVRHRGKLPHGKRAQYRLGVEPLEDRTVPSTVTVSVIDQAGAEITGSAISVPGVGLVATGSQVSVPDGDVTFGIIPKILDTDPFNGGAGLLSRTEVRTV